MRDVIRGLLIEPGGEPTQIAFVDKLEKYQELVGGYIETIQLQDSWGPTGIIAIVNEEGRIRGLEPCGWLEYGAGEWLVGPVLFVRENGDEFDSLKDEDYAKIEECFGRYENDGHIEQLSTKTS